MNDEDDLPLIRFVRKISAKRNNEQDNDSITSKGKHKRGYTGNTGMTDNDGRSSPSSLSQFNKEKLPKIYTSQDQLQSAFTVAENGNATTSNVQQTKEIDRVPVPFHTAVALDGLQPEECPCCLAGFCSSSSPEKSPDLHNMWLIYDENKKKIPLISIAKNINMYYLETFCQPQQQEEQSKELNQEWSVDMIYHHLRQHVLDDEMAVVHDLQDVDGILRVLREELFYTEEEDDETQVIMEDKPKRRHMDDAVFRKICAAYKIKMDLRKNAPIRTLKRALQ